MGISDWVAARIGVQEGDWAAVKGQGSSGESGSSTNKGLGNSRHQKSVRGSEGRVSRKSGREIGGTLHQDQVRHQAGYQEATCVWDQATVHIRDQAAGQVWDWSAMHIEVRQVLGSTVIRTGQLGTLGYVKAL